MKLEGKVALITGSARGLGAGTAKLFGAEGAAVIINYPHKGELAWAKSTFDEIIKSGGEAIMVEADVSKWNEVENMVKEGVDKYGRIDILINNAAVNSMKTVDDLTLDDWNKTISVTLTGSFICIKCVLPIMKQQQKGNIINIASIAPWHASPTIDYNAAKGGILAVTRTIAKHYGKFGIRCNTIAPGFHRTEMSELRREKLGCTYIDNIPVGFIPGPESIAKAALFLASEDSSYIDGHILVVDGGVTCL